MIYPKIQSIFKRDEQTHKFIDGEWSLPEFQYLALNPWEWTEKIDGTNIRVIWVPKSADEMNWGVTFKGKEEKSQTPKFLLEKLAKMFIKEGMIEIFPETSVCLYGEGYGAGIQKAGKLYYPQPNFILFDVVIDGWWLQRQNIEDVASKLGIKVVPTVSINGFRYSNLLEAIEFVKKGFKSKFGDFPAEGLVGKPLNDLKNRAGGRIITKLKYRDFA